MNKLVAFIGSPRKNGNISTIIREIVKGAKEAGGEATIFNLNDMRITSCQSCYYCRRNENCAIEDDMGSIYEAIKNANAVVIGSPVYLYQVTAQTKLLMDRLFPIIDSDYNPRFGIKKAVIVYSQGNHDANAFKQSFDTNAKVFRGDTRGRFETTEKVPF